MSSALPTWLARVADASRAFDSRWTMRALRRVDAPLADKFEEALADWHDTCMHGTDADIREIGGGIVRGYEVISRRMEEAAAEHDAYYAGVCAKTGTRVIISPNKACSDIGAIHVTPDEVAALIGAMEAIKQVKTLMPGCQIIETRPNEPAKGDSA